MTTLDEQLPAGAADELKRGTCIPDICTPNPNCSPWSRSAPADPMRTSDPCLPDTAPERCPPTQQCMPESNPDPRRSTGVSARFLWLDLTRKCQNDCRMHCYNNSGPDGDHGTMTRDDWLSVLDQAVRTGVGRIQLIGGEPTLHPNFAELLDHALMIGLQVEVFSNLVHIKPEWWDLFGRPGVSLATSYYSADAAEHNAVTGRDSHRKTRANIEKATDLGIPLRAGVIAVRPTQNVEKARADLFTIGVKSVGTDRVRHFGRGLGDHQPCDVNELCGNCGDRRAAIGPDGTVSPCIMASWLAVGNIKTAPLAGILAGEDMARATATIPKRVAADPCDPGAECRPDAYPCQPDNDG